MSEEREFLKRFADSKWNYDDWCFLKAVAKELLAQPEPEQTPVAWMYDYISPTLVKHTSVEFGKCPSEEWMTNIRPLYTSPPTRKPLSDDEIRVGMGDEPPISRSGFVRGVKFAEKARGIGGGDENDTQHTN